jgi:uncharacterized protein YndB with AHSA1/START domain
LEETIGVATDDASTMLVESITIDAPIAAVFAALNEPEELAVWWGSDDSYRITASTSDLRVGGAWESTGSAGADYTFTVAGIYRVVEPPHALEFTWHFGAASSDAADETIVRYDLSDGAGGTELRVTHSGFKTAEDRDDQAAGWKTVLGWLNAYLTR